MKLPFHDQIEKWFLDKYSSPTPIQEMSWDSISQGYHTLLSAPTGSGKTLAAFLWAIHKLIDQKEHQEGIPILYISPLKALNNDIEKNLNAPLKELQDYFEQNQLEFPQIQVAVRSGDTPQQDRRKMLKNPPDILITTPESLHILLTSPNGRRFLQGIQTVILDEIHAILESRRGVLLSTAMERLVHLNGEFQRIGLSATVQPMERAARFLGGYQSQGDKGWLARDVKILMDSGNKKYEIQVISPPEGEEDEERWNRIARLCLDIIRNNQSTLFFTDSRRITEKAARLINDLAEETIAWAHHGALSRELRYQVEQKMKDGELRAIVATASLELGIDIGHLDRVVLLQSPSSLGSAMQRIGRAGHQVGESSKASLIPLYQGELLHSAALLHAMERGNLEESRPLRNPLDVLAQLVLSITQGETWTEEDLYRLLQGSWTYHELPKEHFYLVLEMLAGRYMGSNLTELQPRIVWDKLQRTVKAREKGAWLIYTSGGVIPDRGYYELRTADSKTKIGELDEEFVWERNLGESFTLGNQVWKITKITENHVEVIPARGMIHIVPFWKAEDMNRSAPLARAMGEILDQAQENQLSTEVLQNWQERYHFSQESAEDLKDYLKQQQEWTGTPLPSFRHLLFEHCKDNAGGEVTEQLIIHTLRGGAVNQPLALAMVQAWQNKTGVELSYFANNDGITLLTAGPLNPEELLSLLYQEDLLQLLRQRLSGTAFFGARFRECAGRALLLPRMKNKGRVPLWLTRLRSRKLLGAVQSLEDFPITLETWRTSLEDHFDLPGVKELISALQSGETRWSICHTDKPSPFASSLVWRQVNLHMYGDDTPSPKGESALSKELLENLLRSSELRPLLDPAMVNHWESRLQRCAPGYGGESIEELKVWLNQRRLIPRIEWNDFLKNSLESSDLSLNELGEALAPHIFESHGIVGLKENRDLLDLLLEGKKVQGETTREDLILEILSYYGPRTIESLEELYFLQGKLLPLLEGHLEDGTLLWDQMLKDSEERQICTMENLEYLLRRARKERQPHWEPRPLTELPLLLAHQQGLLHRGEGMEDLQAFLDKIIGRALPLSLWEEALFPCRSNWYHPSWLDQILQQSDLQWVGQGEKKISFLFPDETNLWLEAREKSEQTSWDSSLQGKYDFFQLKQLWGKDSRDTAKILWEGVWNTQWSNDGFQVLRKAIQNQFRLPDPSQEMPARSGGRRQLNRWKSSRPMEGAWFTLEPPDDIPEEWEEMERKKERSRQLISRYGILCRPLLQYENSLLRWSQIFPALRLMELSGELVSGFFLKDMPSLQFTTQSFLQQWKELTTYEENIWFLHAQDPASLCGLGLNLDLPHRRKNNWLVYKGSRLMMVLERNGKHMELRFPPDEDFSPHALWEMLLTREIAPLNKIEVEMVNGDKAEASSYRSWFKSQGFKEKGSNLVLRRSY